MNSSGDIFTGRQQNTTNNRLNKRFFIDNEGKTCYNNFVEKTRKRKVLQEMKKSESYNRIMCQRGFEPFKTLIEKWEKLSENIDGRYLGLPIILPDLIMISQTGSGRSRLLSLLSDYLCENGKLMRFSGSTTCFEFMLGYCPPSESFTELPRLMDEVSRAAGFRGEFRGVVFIDIDENYTSEFSAEAGSA
jgi:hypothetical protein